MLQIPGYQVIEPLGKGGMATVYLAVQTSVDREVALKVMAPQLNLDPTFGERFLREARIAAKLHHRHVVSIYDVGVHGDTHYIAMEYIPGGTIMPKGTGPVELKTALRCVREIAGALDYAHAKGFVHRDVKPDNILMREDGSCVLSDFGIARAADSGTAMTKTGSVVGTPHYMSPEQLRGQRIDGRADIYSLGVVFYQLLTGEVPYNASDSLAIGIMHMTAPMPMLQREYNFVQPLLSRMMAKRLEERVQTGADLVKLVQNMEAQLKDTPIPIAPMHARVVHEIGELPSLHAERDTVVAPSGSISRVRTEPQIGRMDVMPQQEWRGPDRRRAEPEPTSWLKPVLWVGTLAAMAGTAYLFREPALAWGQREFPTLFASSAPQLQVPGTASDGDPGATSATTGNGIVGGTDPSTTDGDRIASVDITQPKEPDALEAAQAEAERRRKQTLEAQQAAEAEARAQAQREAVKQAGEAERQAALATRIDELLNDAADLVERNILSGAGSAIEKYRTVLKLEPGNAQAKAGLARVGNMLLEQANKAVKAEQYERAQALLVSAESVGADRRKLNDLKEKLSVQRLPMAQPGLSAADDVRLQTTVEQGSEAMRAGQLLSPPGDSAYDRLRAAQAIARNDPRVEALEDQLIDALSKQLDAALARADYPTVFESADGLKGFSARGRGVSSAVARAADALAAAARDAMGSDRARARELLGYLRSIKSNHPAVAELNAALGT